MDNSSILTHTKKVFFGVYGRIVAILIISAAVILASAVPLGVGAGLSHPFGALWTVLTGIGIGIFATFITFLTAAAIAFVLIRNKSLLESIKFALTKGLRSIPVQLLFLGLLLVSSVPSILLILFALEMLDTGSGLLFMALGVLLLLLPFFLGLRFVFVVFVWLENQKMQAWSIVKRSFTLTQGPVVWRILLSLVVIGVGAAIIHPLLVSLLSALLALPSGENLSMIVDQILSIFLLAPLMYALFYTLYVYAKQQPADVKKRRV